MSSTRSTGQSNVHPHPRKSTVVHRFCFQFAVKGDWKNAVCERVSEDLYTKKKRAATNKDCSSFHFHVSLIIHSSF